MPACFKGPQTDVGEAQCLLIKGAHCNTAATPFAIFESKSMDFHKEIPMKSCLLFILIETYQYDML